MQVLREFFDGLVLVSRYSDISDGCQIIRHQMSKTDLHSLPIILIILQLFTNSVRFFREGFQAKVALTF